MWPFGASKEEVWKQLAQDINANYIEGSLFKGSRIEYKYKNWMIYLDTYSVSTGKSSITYTRMRAPFINTNKFQFKIYKQGILSDIGKTLGVQYIEIGHDFFDNQFIIRSNDEVLVKKIFRNDGIRNLVEMQSKIRLEVKDGEGMFSPRFEEDESQLSFSVPGVIKEVDTLKNLFELFTKILTEFEMNGITINKTPEVKL